MKRVNFVKEIIKKNNLNKKDLEKICKKYNISKAKIFGFLSFSENFFKKIKFKK